MAPKKPKSPGAKAKDPQSPEAARAEIFQKHFPEGSQGTPGAAGGEFLGQGPGCAGRDWGKVREEWIYVPSVPGHGAAARWVPLSRSRARAAPCYRSPSNGESALLVPRRTLRLCFQPRGDKGLCAGGGWGLRMGKNEPSLNQNREAGLLEMARRRMLAPAVTPAPLASGPWLRAGEAGRRATCQAGLTMGSLESVEG